MRAARRGHTEVVRLILERGVDVFASVGDSKLDALNYACMDGRNEVVELLLAAGAPLQGYPDGDMTPLMWAARNGHLSTIRLLLDRGADPSAITSQGQRAIDFAAKHRHTEVVRLLEQLT
jgi:ankyrin repeat protein